MVTNKTAFVGVHVCNGLLCWDSLVRAGISNHSIVYLLRVMVLVGCTWLKVQPSRVSQLDLTPEVVLLSSALVLYVLSLTGPKLHIDGGLRAIKHADI